MQRRKLAIVTTHPIQYYAPVFRALAESEGMDVRVFYTWSQPANEAVLDPGFGAVVQWDIPLLNGYASQFVTNVSRAPGVDRFGGIRNPTLIKDIEVWGADALLVYGWNAHSHLRAIRHFAGRIPVLFRGDSTLLDRRSRTRGWLRRIFLRWVYRHVDMAIAVGSNSRDYFAWCGLPPQRIAVAPHSVDTHRFADTTEHETRAAQWRCELGIPANGIVFLFAGKLQAKKDPALLLEAFTRLGARAHLVFVGGGELAEQLRARAATRHRVHFLPFQNQSVMPVVYRLGDVFVLPSRGPGETWGLAVNEAMASGRPVIASSKVGAARDLVMIGHTGWVFDAGHVEDLRNKMSSAMRRGQRGLALMGAKAQSLSVDWSTEESARRIRDAVFTCQRR